MVVESLIAIEVALKAGIRPVSFFVDERQAERLLGLLEELGLWPSGGGSSSELVGSYGQACGNGQDGQARPVSGKQASAETAPFDVLVADRELMSEVCGFKVTRGFLSVMERPAALSIEQVEQGARRIAVLEDQVDASNVGAIFRSAAALGVDGLILSPHCLDPLCRRAIRTSMGTVFQIPWARACEPWPAKLADLLHEDGFELVGMALDPDALPLDDPSLAHVARLALLFGTEGAGLSREALQVCDQTVIIPMSHGVDSLNVAASSAVAFWELCARSQRGSGQQRDSDSNPRRDSAQLA